MTDNNFYPHYAAIKQPDKDDLYLVDYLVAGVHKINTAQAMIHFNPAYGWRNKITPCFVGDKPKDSKFAVLNMVGFKPIFGIVTT